MFLAILIIGLLSLLALLLFMEWFACRITGGLFIFFLFLAFTLILIGTGGVLYEREQELSRKCTEGYVYHDGICVQGYEP